MPWAAAANAGSRHHTGLRVDDNHVLRAVGVAVYMTKPMNPPYEKTAAYGHFGREEPEFTWERTDKAATLRAAAGL